MKKYSFNYINIILGLFLIVCYFIISPEKVCVGNLTNIELTLKSNPTQIKGYRSRIAYTFESIEYAAKFQITKPGAMAAGWDVMKEIKEDETLNAFILITDSAFLNSINRRIKIFALQRKGKALFSVEEYNKSSNKYYRRWRLLFIISGLLLFCRGLDVITSQSAWGIAVLCALVIIVLRWKNIWW